MIAAIPALKMPIRAEAGLPRRVPARLSIGASKGPKAKVDWADLIGRVAADGDREAFKRLFEHFAPRIKGLMLKAGCSSDEAEEIAQSTLIAVWRKAHQFDPATAGAPAWIFTIARNLRIDLFRRRARIDRLQAGSELPDEPDQAEPADILISRGQDAARIALAIRQLSAEQSMVVRLSFIEERPHPEIASALGIPLGTVKSRIRLAMNRLRDILDEEA
ncbi:RNA polymerase sigma-70 factor (ECF subfamily) [Bradyrhizobium centrosematis]|jgi:RNA polymerase sigma-70 factor (ECF subfamily)|nr:RNA polymerase sigma-70 factor (ECF subfamily) [Bradyrhizobium centrosematis]MCS3776586.1 RNA polymerase sigma-70 factor (ECF subfamily) [Bradyrhizobium centrosematis]